MKLKLVGEAKIVLFRAWSSLFGMAATLFVILAQYQDQLPLIQAYVPPKTFMLLTIGCSIASVLSRVIRQDRLRELTGPANPQPGDPS